MLIAEGEAQGAVYKFRTGLPEAVSADLSVRYTYKIYIVPVRELQARTLYGCYRAQPDYKT
jgi:hypothetical protein